MEVVHMFLSAALQSRQKYWIDFGRVSLFPRTFFLLLLFVYSAQMAHPCGQPNAPATQLDPAVTGRKFVRSEPIRYVKRWNFVHQKMNPEGYSTDSSTNSGLCFTIFLDHAMKTSPVALLNSWTLAGRKEKSEQHDRTYISRIVQPQTFQSQIFQVQQLSDKLMQVLKISVLAWLLWPLHQHQNCRLPVATASYGRGDWPGILSLPDCHLLVTREVKAGCWWMDACCDYLKPSVPQCRQCPPWDICTVQVDQQIPQ